MNEARRYADDFKSGLTSTEKEEQDNRRHKSRTVLECNGLVGGRLYVFVSNDPSRNSEATFENGQLEGRWIEIPREERENDVELEAASDARNAFGFVRIEDGAFGKSKNEFFFQTTGDSQPSTINRLGMNYRLQFNRNQDPEQQKPRLSVVTTPTRSTPPTRTSRSAPTTWTSSAARSLSRRTARAAHVRRWITTTATAACGASMAPSRARARA